MSLLFVGDVAYPFMGCVEISDLLKGMRGTGLVGNLEGPVGVDPMALPPMRDGMKINLHSCSGFLSLASDLGFCSFGLSNNHSTDFWGGLEKTKDLMACHGISFFGTSDKPFDIIQKGDTVAAVLGVCSRITGVGFDSRRHGINLLRPKRALKEITKLVNDYPEAKVVVFVHWGLDLSRYPVPAEREWARSAIAHGAHLVLGHHPHVVQGVEAVGNGIIAYSVGNFILPEVEFAGRTLSFKDVSSKRQLGVKLTGNEISFHWFEYDKASRRIVPRPDIGCSEGARIIDQLTPFRGMTDKEYRVWYQDGVRSGEIEMPKFFPVFWSFNGAHKYISEFKFFLMFLRTQVRKIAIRLGVHRPYNW